MHHTTVTCSGWHLASESTHAVHAKTQMQYAPEHDLKELTYANENTKIFNPFKTSLYAFYAYRPQHILKFRTDL